LKDTDSENRLELIENSTKKIPMWFQNEEKELDIITKYLKWGKLISTTENPISALFVVIRLRGFRNGLHLIQTLDKKIPIWFENQQKKVNTMYKNELLNRENFSQPKIQSFLHLLLYPKCAPTSFSLPSHLIKAS